MNTIIQRFRYCPICGSTEFRQNSVKSLLCGDCHFEYFLNPAAAVVAVILDDKHRLLTVRRRLDPARGTLDLPGGFCDMGETTEQGVAREVMEETGLHVDTTKFLFSLPNNYMYARVEIPTTDLFFLCQVSNTSEAHAMDDAADCQWLPFDEIDPAKFGLHSIRKGVEILLKQTDL